MVVRTDRDYEKKVHHPANLQSRKQKKTSWEMLLMSQRLLRAYCGLGTILT